MKAAANMAMLAAAITAVQVEAELRTGLRIRGDTARIVVGGAGDRARARLRQPGRGLRRRRRDGAVGIGDDVRPHTSALDFHCTNRLESL
jgi:hypothetical protein